MDYPFQGCQRVPRTETRYVACDIAGQFSGCGTSVGDDSSAAQRAADPAGWAMGEDVVEALRRVVGARRDEDLGLGAGAVWADGHTGGESETVLGKWLAARGIGRGDRIGIRMPSGSSSASPPRARARCRRSTASG